MKKIMQTIKTSSPQLIALVILGCAMLSAGRRAALPAIWAILKFALPFIVLWIIWRVIKAKVSGIAKKFQDQVMAAAAAQQNGAGNRYNPNSDSKNQVLDLCPQCGEVLKPSHRCRK